MARSRKRLGEILKEWELVTDDQIHKALEKQMESGHRIGEILIEMGLVKSDDVVKALALQFDMEYVDLDVVSIGHDVFELIPENIIREYTVLPLARDKNRLKVAITDPLDLDTIDALRFRLNMDIETALAPKEKVQAVISSYTGQVESNDVDSMMQEFTETYMEGGARGDGEKGGGEGDDAPIIRLVTLIVTEAVRMRASDIHIEPMASRVRVRYRIDGKCMDRDAVPKRLQGAVLSRIKIMSGMAIEEKRLPQDGRIRMKLEGQDLDFRVSSLPAYHGESMVLRILRKESVKVGLGALGFSTGDYEKFLKVIRRPNGIFLVTGPTGSGKTTTLYSALDELNRPDRKIITAEDPVEYNLTGINQCQVRESIGLTFASILRAMLRQAPNIILVGEIRDIETAEIAVQAALTGHLVFSTLHTNDAPSALTRLIDMGVKPFLVSSSIQAVMAQRLVRLLCNECKVPDEEVDTSLLQALGLTADQISKANFMRPVGCDRCNGTGYHGRCGVFEIMVMNNELREMAFQQAPLNELRKAAIAFGMHTLLDDGLAKAMQGVTALEDILATATREVSMALTATSG
ncbi:MAG TPA: ATPase, T2SS/T4P/T4SS family [Phycisphaerae bacterium]|nr:Flp pilus assembly complex ATPase component TadA [Phycisphaerae bacterium]HOI54992.1 ATPase, T2SS/T4P/T4SS family [Phycisphaerae bacterium]